MKAILPLIRNIPSVIIDEIKLLWQITYLGSFQIIIKKYRYYCMKESYKFFFLLHLIKEKQKRDKIGKKFYTTGKN